VFSVGKRIPPERCRADLPFHVQAEAAYLPPERQAELRAWAATPRPGIRNGRATKLELREEIRRRWPGTASRALPAGGSERPWEIARDVTPAARPADDLSDVAPSGPQPGGGDTPGTSDLTLELVEWVAAGLGLARRVRVRHRRRVHLAERGRTHPRPRGRAAGGGSVPSPAGGREGSPPVVGQHRGHERRGAGPGSRREARLCRGGSTRTQAAFWCSTKCRPSRSCRMRAACGTSAFAEAREA
jgi:hypothetical protein